MPACVCVRPYTACVHPSVHGMCVSVHMVCVCVVHLCACAQHARVSAHSVCVCVCPFTVCVCMCTSLTPWHPSTPLRSTPGGTADVEVEIAEQMLLRVLPGPVLPIPLQARPVMRGLVFVPLNLSPSTAGKCWFSCSIFIGKSPTHPGDGFIKHTQAQNWICLEPEPGPPVSARCDSWGPQRGPFVPLQMDGGAWRLGGAARESWLPELAA